MRAYGSSVRAVLWRHRRPAQMAFWGPCRGLRPDFRPHI